VVGFSSVNYFLEEFGIEPVEVDPNLAFCRYVMMPKNSELEVDISFSAVMASFQVVLRLAREVLMSVSSESVSFIEFVRDGSGAGIHVVFDICESKSEAWVMIEPEVSCRWWTLCNS